MKTLSLPPAAPIHRDADAGGERAGEGRAGKPAALAGVEDLRLATARQRLLDRRDAERDIPRVRQAPGQPRPARPIDGRREGGELNIGLSIPGPPGQNPQLLTSSQ
ncbi:MAG: hypothetical protein WA648_15675 [Methylocella sp.]